jgi:hypothetical protein
MVVAVERVQDSRAPADDADTARGFAAGAAWVAMEPMVAAGAAEVAMVSRVAAKASLAARVPMEQTLLNSREGRVPDKRPVEVAPNERPTVVFPRRPVDQPGRMAGSSVSALEVLGSGSERRTAQTSVPPTVASSDPSLCPSWLWVRKGEVYLKTLFLARNPLSTTPTKNLRTEPPQRV